MQNFNPTILYLAIQIHLGMLSRHLDGKYSSVSQFATLCSPQAAWSNSLWLFAIYREDLALTRYPRIKTRQAFSTFRISGVVLKQQQHQGILWGWQLKKYCPRIKVHFKSCCSFSIYISGFLHRQGVLQYIQANSCLSVSRVLPSNTKPGNTAWLI